MVFKVNWEKAHTQYQLSNQTIKEMLYVLYPKKDIQSVQVIDGGCANINVKVQFYDDNNFFILRVYYRDINSAVKEHKIALLLKEKLLVPQTYKIGTLSDYTFAITEFIPGVSLRDILMQGLNNSEIAAIMFKVGEVLAHIAQFKFKKSGFFSETLDVIDEITKEKMVEDCLNILECSNIQNLLSKTRRKQIHSLIQSYGYLFPDTDETNLVHGDFDPANILVSRVDNKLAITGVLDWEFACSGSTLHDVGKMLRYAHYMPKIFEQSFINGLLNHGFLLHQDWQRKIKMLNIYALLECLRRSDANKRPNQVKDIQELLKHIIAEF